MKCCRDGEWEERGNGAEEVMGDGEESQRPRRIKGGRSMEGVEPRGRGRRFEKEEERPSAEVGKQRAHTDARKREEVAGFPLT